MGYLDQQDFRSAMPFRSGAGDYLDIYRALADTGDDHAMFELGCAYSTGSHGLPCDMVEAHKWFNLAAANGHEEAPQCRFEVASEMTAREIADAQRNARAWLIENARLNA